MTTPTASPMRQLRDASTSDITAEMLMRLYPSERARLLEARAHLEEALQMQPQYHHGRKRLAELDVMLNSADVRRN